MKKMYLTLSILGFLAPNIFVAIVSYQTGNIMLWLDPLATLNGMFANNISSTFVVDLLFVVVVFFVWTYREAAQYRMKNLWVIWVLTMFLGLAGTLPLFLYLREDKLVHRGNQVI